MTTALNSNVSSSALLPLNAEDANFHAEPSSDTPPSGAIEWCESEDFETAAETVPSDPDIWLYRDRTTGLLWRYVRLAVEIGRLPSLLGREFFRARVSPYSAQTFEDSVIFVHDVECCLDALDPADKILIAILALEQYTQEEAARSLRCTQRTIVRQYASALDHLSELFLQREILVPLPSRNTNSPQACQEANRGDFRVSDSAQGKNNF